MFRKSIFTLLLGAMLAGSGAIAGAQSTGNSDNTPFATVANGLVGPLIVDVPSRTTRAAAQMAVSQALRQHMPTPRAAEGTYEFLVRHRLLQPGSSLNFQRPVVLRQNGQLLLPDLARLQQSRGRLGGGEITFTYEGWTTEDAQRVSQFVQLMYPIAKQVYGSPSANITVKIVRDDTLTDATMHLRNGIYNASTNEIRINPTGTFEDDMYSLTHLILYAFHDDAMFAYDAWEEGFTWAANYVIFKRIYSDFNLGDSFKTFYFLQLYELLNKPGIGNIRFWPSNFDSLVAADRAAVFPFTLFVFRSAMAGAAWVKVYTENNNFFRDFNAAYYQQFSANLAGRVPALKAIAAGIVPTVEGYSFQDWYRRQYILDSSATAGPQLWTWALPQFDRDDGAGGHLVLLIYNFTRDTSGNEIPQGGAANLIYYSWDFVQDYFAEEGNQVTIPAAGTDAGVGSFSPGIFNVGGAQKINVQISVGGLTRVIPWPYLVRGTEADPNSFFGVTQDTDTGEVGVIVGSGVEQKTALSQAAFGMKAGLNGWNKTSVRVTDTSGRSVTRQVNTGFDFYVVVAQGPRPTAETFTQTLTAGAHMISTPAYPTVSDAEALGISANQLRLAHWDPLLNTGDVNYRYRVYPSTPPLAPGLGYWLILDQPTTITFQGNPLPQDQSHVIPLHAGWNQIGNPFLQSVPISSLSVITDASDPTLPAIDLATAVNQGKLSGTFWRFDQTLGYVAATTLEPWQGYWVRANADILLKVPAVNSPGTNPSSALTNGNHFLGESRSRAAQSTGDWRLHLIARAGNVAGGAVVGVSRAASNGFDALYDAECPPVMGNYVRLSMNHNDWGRSAGSYALDVRAAGATQQSWDINLETSLRNQDVQLTWPNMAGIPRDVRLVLTDLDGGRRCYLRTSGGITINSGDTGRRRLRLEAVSGTAAALAITNIQVNQTRATGSMAIQYALSADALVDAQIISPTGRLLRDITRAAASRAGVNNLTWDGRSANGARLASGLYLLQLTATTEEGQSVRSVRPLMIVR